MQKLIIFVMLLGIIQSIHGQEGDSSKVEEVYLIAQKMPVVKEGRESWKQWIQANNRFYNSPQIDDEYNVVFVEYIVDSSGIIRDVKCIRGIGEPYDNEAVRLVTECPLEWLPGQQYNKPVNVKEVRPIYFTDHRPKK